MLAIIGVALYNRPIKTKSMCGAVAGHPIVENFLAGYNSSIFAYGQTGAGKTYTMIGQLGHSDQVSYAFCCLLQLIHQKQGWETGGKVWSRAVLFHVMLLCNNTASISSSKGLGLSERQVDVVWHVTCLSCKLSCDVLLRERICKLLLAVANRLCQSWQSCPIRMML